VFNKLDDDVKRDSTDSFYLFFKILKKLGKNKLISFLEMNSPFLKSIIEFVNKDPMVGYAPSAIDPFNTF